MVTLSPRLHPINLQKLTASDKCNRPFLRDNVLQVKIRTLDYRFDAIQ